jgi:hypothetical protein
MVIKPSGNIGMGTLVPDNYNDEADNLVVESAGHTGLTIASIPAGDDKYRGNIYFADAASGTSEYSGAITYDHADDNMSFRTSSYERMWIADNGYVGIGVDTPSAKLDIRKGGGSQYAAANDFLKNPSGQHAIALTTGGWRNASVINQQTGATTVNLTLASTGLYLNSSYGSKTFSSSSIHVNCDTSNGDISFLTGDGDTAPTTKVKITNNGNVGINKTTPYTKLYVESTDGLRIPVGTTAQRPTNAVFGITASSPTDAQYVPKLGTIRYNTTQSTFEGFGAGNNWGSLGGVIDPDRDTYWTAVNDLDNLHDPGQTTDVAGHYGTDEFTDTDYPGDVDYLRAFTQGVKRFAIASNGDSRWYFKSGGSGATAATPYTYQTMLQISTATGGSTIFNPTQQKDITIKTEDMASTAAGPPQLQAGDINIISGAAADRTTNGDGNHGGNVTIRTGDGGNAQASGHTGGTGGHLYIRTGTKGTGTNPGDDGVIDIIAPGAVKLTGATDLYTYNGDNSLIRFGVDSAAGIVSIPAHNGSNAGLKLGTTIVTATGAELNIMDGGTTAWPNMVLNNDDRVVVNDAGVMKQVASSVFTTFFESTIVTLQNLETAHKLSTVGDLDAGSITSGFGSINTGTDSISGGSGGFSSLGVGVQPTATAGEINASADIIAFSSSDERLKDNVTPISDPIEKLSKIGGYEFDWKDNDECSHTGHDVGVIAQEIEQVLPDIVTTRDSGYKAVKYEKLTALLIEVTKSQQAQIDELKRQVEQLSK